jgi:hypothetical protein
VKVRFAVHQLQRVADGDVGQCAALSGDDFRAPPQRQACGIGRYVGVGLA